MGPGAMENGILVEGKIFSYKINAILCRNVNFDVTIMTSWRHYFWSTLWCFCRQIISRKSHQRNFLYLLPFKGYKQNSKLFFPTLYRIRVKINSNEKIKLIQGNPSNISVSLTKVYKGSFGLHRFELSPAQSSWVIMQAIDPCFIARIMNCKVNDDWSSKNGTDWVISNHEFGQIFIYFSMKLNLMMFDQNISYSE